MSGVTTSSLSLAWSLRNWVILDYEEANGQMKRPWAPFLLSFHLPLEDLPRNKDSLNMSDKAWQKGSRGGTETLLMTGRVFFFPVFLTTCHRQCFPNRTCQTHERVHKKDITGNDPLMMFWQNLLGVPPLQAINTWQVIPNNTERDTNFWMTCQVLYACNDSLPCRAFLPYQLVNASLGQHLTVRQHPKGAFTGW